MVETWHLGFSEIQYGGCSMAIKYLFNLILFKRYIWQGIINTKNFLDSIFQINIHYRCNIRLLIVSNDTSKITAKWDSYINE